MTYLSGSYYLFLALLLVVYYCLPLKFRWLCLLAGSLAFYLWIARESALIFLFTLVSSFLLGLLFPKIRQFNPEHPALRRFCLCLGLLIVISPLLITKYAFPALSSLMQPRQFSWLVPMGISFYTLQIVSYLADVYTQKIQPQHNFLKYALFVSFFPQIVQGPIPRYEQLGEQLYEGHPFHETQFTKGIHLIIWGFFLKLMIADKAGIIVDTIFDQFPMYTGSYCLLGGILYSIQLYTDFMACTTISQGVAGLFGIQLIDNFHHPYAATSVREFWKHWHMSLSSWLRDYVYIPLGGNRKGRFAQRRNLLITFAVSGIWHGAGPQFLIWGLLHAFYQLISQAVSPIRDWIYRLLSMPKESLTRKLIQTAGTFFWVMLAWILFRAGSLQTGLGMIYSIFTTHQPWIFFDGSLFLLGLEAKEWIVLVSAILFLCFVERRQTRGSIRDWLLEQHLLVRWGVYLLAICTIWIFGTYGYGFRPQDFIYGGF